MKRKNSCVLFWAIAVQWVSLLFAIGEVRAETQSGDRTRQQSHQHKESWQQAKLLYTLSEHSDSVWSLAIDPDGRILASGSLDGTVKLWNLQTGELLDTLIGHFNEQ